MTKGLAISLLSRKDVYLMLEVHVERERRV